MSVLSLLVASLAVPSQSHGYRSPSHPTLVLPTQSSRSECEPAVRSITGTVIPEQSSGAIALHCPEYHPRFSPLSSSNSSSTSSSTSIAFPKWVKYKACGTEGALRAPSVPHAIENCYSSTSSAVSPGVMDRVKVAASAQSPLPAAAALSIQSRFEPALPELLPSHVIANPYLPNADLFDLSWARGDRPRSGSQLYRQRLEALRQGKTYTRLPANSYREVWVNATQQPTYEQWVSLLQQEAAVMAKGQGSSRLTVIVGDSLSLWFPVEQLSIHRFWLNQGISGDTTGGILNRLSAFDETHPDVIHVMAGVNDLKNGKSNTEILTNLRRIMQRLRQNQPQAQVFIYSILPTRLAAIPNDRIRQLNQRIAQLTAQEQVSYVDLTPYFVDREGTLQRELTTDGLHLSPRGYAVWNLAIESLSRVSL